MDIDIIGVVHHKGEIETFGQNGFQKATVTMMTVEQNPQYYPVELWQHNTDLLDDLEEGKNYKIRCGLRGRIGETQNGSRAFLSLVGWKVTPL
ncbi:DUF3127 domain-containing protein [Flagellimonas nanhaiensis]|uniref:DUF3127 domain-containing protein n=1 Tax=Flagellimonas nanhaiensis TaxID=2292706 RepID=A0A371JMY7_9FLAO|nr:DUF3127 domain-containing protein [Allomuricauda nanhaiensis]RDY58475.1 DUF3127 domain-containing protein [Allomuricauda nanhaiensis]